MSEPSIEIIARGVFIHQDRLLVCQSKLGHAFLPGGHIEFGERAADALVREIREEMGVELRVDGFLGACEACFDQTNRSGKVRRHHEVNLVFRLVSPHGDAFDPAAVSSQEDHIEFRWIPVSVAKDLPILPSGIATLVTGTGGESRWISLFE